MPPTKPKPPAESAAAPQSTPAATTNAGTRSRPLRGQKGNPPKTDGTKHIRLTAHGKGRRYDVPWDEIERLFVQGEMRAGATRETERVWPSCEDLAARFEMGRSTVIHRSHTDGWMARREEFRRLMRQRMDEAQASTIAKSADMWSPQAEKAWNLNVGLLDEVKFALDFHRSGRAAALRSKSVTQWKRPSGGDTAAQLGMDAASGEPGAEEADPSKREPVPPRDLKDLAATVKTAQENLRALLVGTTAPGTIPQSVGGAGSPGAASPPGLPVGDPRCAALVDAFVKHIGAGSRTPEKGT